MSELPLTSLRESVDDIDQAKDNDQHDHDHKCDRYLEMENIRSVRCFLADESGLTSNLAFLQAMNGQYLCNRQITTSYAYKKDTKGERHEIPAGKNLCLRKMKLRTLGSGYLSLIKIVELCFTYAITIWICQLNFK
ncbi:Splicing factor 3B subunit 4 [Capsicum baccatum]|uniref:Splicing factor 3B subunit 4 n=1 Tax=Capsicum baccatum TaxID=33114 RepID=A0A2G2WY63_CAPBA|nr:Splicing factor 3B subunit 4 [Capsicum baccatum]